MTVPQLPKNTSDRWLFYGLLALLAWLPIPFGSNRPLSWAVLEIAAFSLLSIWLVLQLLARTKAPTITGNVRLVLLLFVASLAYQALQIIPLPLEVIRVLSPATHHIYNDTQAETAREYFSISFDIGLSVDEFVKSAAYTAIFFLVLVLVSSKKRLRQVVYLLILVGFGQALFGLLDVYLEGNLFKAYFSAVRVANHMASGTFASYNSFGALLELAIPLALGMLLARHAGQGHIHGWRSQLRAFAHLMLSGKVWLPIYLFVMTVALFYSRSRGAAVSLIIGNIVLLVIALSSQHSHIYAPRKLPLLLIPVVFAVWVGASPLIERLETQGFAAGTRSIIRTMTYPMIADYPAFGIGSGNWSQLYPVYGDPQVYEHKTIKYVHNDYLQLLAEQGIVGFTIFGSAVLIAFGTVLSGLRRRRDPFFRGVLYASGAGTLALLIHALVEFNHHIPANAAWFTVILAMGLIAARMPHDA